MDVEIKEVTKNEYKKFFEWLFGNEVKIREEIDITMSHTYEDSNIYYTEEIYTLFQTKAMQRLGKILHLGSVIIEKTNTYYTRLEHSKGAYRRCIEFLAIKFRDEQWKKYIEQNHLKGYLVEKIKFMCVHDIGHSMLSHSLERVVGDKNCTHEDIGQKILSEDSQIKKALEKIRANEEYSNKGDGSLEQFCEGNIDFDREDYLVRDLLFTQGEDTSELMLKLNTMCSLKNIIVNGKEQKRYVFRPEALQYIEQFINLRDKMYRKEYRNKERKFDDNISAYFLEEICQGKIENIEELREYIQKFNGKSIKEIDIQQYLQSTDMLWFSNLIEFLEKVEDENLQEIVNALIPNDKALLQVAINMINPKSRKTPYSEEEKRFLRNIKKVLEGSVRKDEKENGKNSRKQFGIVIESQEEQIEELQKELQEVLEEKNIKGMQKYTRKYKKYDANTPIYVEDTDGAIYHLEEHPKLSISLEPYYKHGIYIIPSILKYEGIEEDKIDRCVQILKKHEEPEQNKKYNINNQMNLFAKQPGNQIDYNSKYDEYFESR